MGMAIVTPGCLCGEWKKYQEGKTGIEEIKAMLESGHSGDEVETGAGAGEETP